MANMPRVQRSAALSGFPFKHQWWAYQSDFEVYKSVPLLVPAHACSQPHTHSRESRAVALRH